MADSLSTFSTTPRYAVRRVIAKQYCVAAVMQQGSAYQVLRVLDLRDERVKVLKAVSRTLVDDAVIARNLAWLGRARKENSRHFTMLAHFYAPADWFMVFDMPGYTLQNLLKDSELLPLPSRQIREIIAQIIAALSDLHKRGLVHLNVSPASIEILDRSTIVESVYRGKGRFEDKTMLKCARIRLVFFGDAGICDDELVGVDSYRAPEIVLVSDEGMGTSFRSDIFSVGCIFWEMLKGRPMFAACEGQGCYVKAKVHMFVVVLGEFPVDMVAHVRFLHEGIFKGRTSAELMGRGDLPNVVLDFLDSAESLQESVDDQDVLDVLEYLTKLAPLDRSSLEDVLEYRYFEDQSDL
ncbi:hypothetical protein CVT26_011187 [Gymnopilus dilepis]|uniref:Protein kinase domain-containing protein n=1 Tax=Gymnopilus dilepis TaxID=231916 RepID=A0A409VJP0_9AGAR|nr:hypothetical protein CVT26_011187 [Gymnopilus dilepis]